MQWGRLQRIMFELENPGADWETHQQGKKADSRTRTARVVRNPHIVTAYFSRRVDAVMRQLFAGKVQRFWHINEYQGRGSVHVHGFLWMLDAPRASKHGKLEDLEWRFRDLFETYQEADRRKYDQDCWFGGMTHKRDKAARDPDMSAERLDEFDKSVEGKLFHDFRAWGDYFSKYVSAFNHGQDLGEGKFATFNPAEKGNPCTWDFGECKAVDDLNALVNTVQVHRECTEGVCLREKKKPDGSTEAFCKHDFPKECEAEGCWKRSRRAAGGTFAYEWVPKRNHDRCNKYSPKLLRGWRANMDLTPCTSMTMLLQYVTKYVTKLEFLFRCHIACLFGAAKNKTQRPKNPKNPKNPKHIAIPTPAPQRRPEASPPHRAGGDASGHELPDGLHQGPQPQRRRPRLPGPGGRWHPPRHSRPQVRRRVRRRKTLHFALYRKNFVPF